MENIPLHVTESERGIGGSGKLIVELEPRFGAVQELLDEVNSLLDFDVEFDDVFPAELRQRILYFLESPTELFSLDTKRDITGGANKCWVILKPSDGFLDLVLALRAWNRNREVAV